MMQANWEKVTAVLARTVDVDERLRVFYAGPLPATPPPPFDEVTLFGGTGPVEIGLVCECARGKLQLFEGRQRTAGAQRRLLLACMQPSQ